MPYWRCEDDGGSADDDYESGDDSSSNEADSGDDSAGDDGGNTGDSRPGEEYSSFLGLKDNDNGNSYHLSLGADDYIAKIDQMKQDVDRYSPRDYLDSRDRGDSEFQALKNIASGLAQEAVRQFDQVLNNVFVCVDTPGQDQTGACLVLNGDVYSYNGQSSGTGGLTGGFAPFGAANYLQGESVSAVFPVGLVGLGVGYSSEGPALLIGTPSERESYTGNVGIPQGNIYEAIGREIQDSARSLREDVQKMIREGHQYLYNNGGSNHTF